MSLYYETAPFLIVEADSGSLKSRVFSNTRATAKSQSKQIYALASESAKWSPILAEVIEQSQLLELERKLSPELAILLVHDLLITKNGIAAPTSHPLRQAVERHKARLNAEFVKSRLKRGCSGIEALRNLLKRKSTDEGPFLAASGPDHCPSFHPRWARVNTLKTTTAEQLRTTFADYEQLDSLETLARSASLKVLHIDEQIPDLLALPSSTDLTKSPAYQTGQLILQDKASCFPAYLLDPRANDGDIVDACAAPGNKTTHLASLQNGGDVKIDRSKVVIHACERDDTRANVLSKMVNLAGADGRVKIHVGQDFLRVDTGKLPWKSAQSLLLDPSCSGSGIIGRDDAFHVTLPQRNAGKDSVNPKKRKRKPSAPKEPSEPEVTEQYPLQSSSVEETSKRLKALSTFQIKLLLHAFSFPEARRIVYSTCSIHGEENEQVVMKALLSDIAKNRAWRILRRDEQIAGLRKWQLRGQRTAIAGLESSDGDLDTDEIVHACIRCEKGTLDGTQGFFLAGFVREVAGSDALEEVWEGFGDPG